MTGQELTAAANLPFKFTNCHQSYTTFRVSKDHLNYFANKPASATVQTYFAAIEGILHPDWEIVCQPDPDTGKVAIQVVPKSEAAIAFEKYCADLDIQIELGDI